MKHRMFFIASKIISGVDAINYYILFATILIVAGPFLFIGFFAFEGYKWLKERWIRFRHPEDFEFEEVLSTIADKILDRKMEFTDHPGLYEKVINESAKLDYFHFFRKRSFSYPFNTLLYVENEYNEPMHRFFEQGTLFEEWKAWHGWNVLFLDKETVKKDMFLPEKYDEHFNHGFLWYSHASNSIVSSSLSGDIFYYHEISPTTDDDIIHQMHAMMSNIYKEFEWQLI